MLITTQPTLTSSSNNTSDISGLYMSTATNTGKPTYYFRGDVENNYVSFVGFTWRIIRINEDGTIRIILVNGINDTAYVFNSNDDNKLYMYYTNSNAKTQLERWYQTNIASNTKYFSKVASGNYFCEQAKVAYASSYASSSGANMTVYSSYIPDFRCSTDGNGYGLVSASIGLITYDEIVFAGGYYNQANSNYYLSDGTSYYWTMSPSGFGGSIAHMWYMESSGLIHRIRVSRLESLRPVINLNVDVIITGNGTSTDPYVIQF